MNESDSMSQKALQALKEAARSAVDHAIRHGTHLVVWRDGQIVHLQTDELRRIAAEWPPDESA